ncbi:hypothetical protein BC829DRAFT_391237 [Chytridium lagenaria]|nr:hypothetical protein BC829DRAFT_391237 [Chytridium lagenaria]
MPHLWRLTPSASTPENAPMKPMTSPLPPPSVPNLLFDDSTAARYQQHYHPEAFLPFMQTSTFEEQVVEGSSMRKAKVEPETSFTCTVDDCGKTFPTQAQLSAHRKTHGKPHEKFRCEYPECGKVFPQVKSLLVHSRIHTGDRPYVCPYPDCGRAFVQASGLRSHNYTHTGERPYKCSVCPKSYTTSSRLKIHFRDHTDELPYVCGFEGCNKQFKQSSNLRQHEITHIPRSDRIPVIRGLACGFCGQAYKTDDSLDQHIRKAHPGRTLSESNDMASRMGLPGTFKRKDEEDEEEGEGVTGKRVKVEECETPRCGGTQSAGGQTVTAPQTPVEKEGFDMGNL